MSAMRERENNLFRTLHQRRSSIGLAYKELLLVGVLSVASALGQASVLLVVVRVATALTAETKLISGSVGPITATDITTGNLILIGFGLSAFVYLIDLVLAWALASLQASALRTTQTRILREFSQASFDAQSALPRGDTQQIVFSHAIQAANVVAALGGGLSALLSFLVLVGSAVALSPVAALVVVGGLLVILTGLRPLVLISRRKSRQRATEQRSLGRTVTERLELNKEVLAFGVGEPFADSIDRKIDSVSRLTRQVRMLARSTSATYQAGTVIIVLATLAMIDATNTKNLATLTAALLMLLRSMTYGQAAQSTYQSLSETAPIVEQLAEESDRLRLARRRGSPDPLAPEHIGTVVFDDVSFAYRDGEPVLRNVSFSITKGSFTAFVGRSGAGKSTAMALLLGLREPDTGSIRFDSTDASTVGEGWLSKRIAFVAQEPKLQSGTVMEAIRFLRSEITDEAVIHAAERAHIAHEVRSWPEGFATDVGELGDRVSGGQRQRISIARALAGSPELLLLDEPTSSLDPGSEALISQTLAELRGEMTIVVIAHRRRTVEHADQVVLFEQGKTTQTSRPSSAELAAYFNEGDDGA